MDVNVEELVEDIVEDAVDVVVLLGIAVSVAFVDIVDIDVEEVVEDTVVDEELDELKASLEHALHVFQGILDDVSSGEYTKDKAKRDIENLECNDGIDVMSVLSDYAGE